MMTPSLRQTLALGLVAGSTGLAACGVSTQQEVQIGREYAAEINRQLPIIDDPAIHRYVNDLGNRIQRQPGNRDIPYTFYVVNSNEVNAFAVPGGFVYVTRELIERTDNLAELAGVLAHEVAHVEERHSAEMLERQQTANVGVGIASILLGAPPSGLAGAAVNIGAQAYFARYSREAEVEADAVAVRLLPGAGIDPNGLVTFFMELLEERSRTPSALEQWFSTHPLTEERIANVRTLIRQTPEAQNPNLASNSSDFAAFQRRVRALPQPPRQ
ncbi:MAG TPA: M48 family metallopeptidase [Longimicrobiales bacterium]|nr:M48 family metallopeptidase [Longimicrobiales bacterium]